MYIEVIYRALYVCIDIVTDNLAVQDALNMPVLLDVCYFLFNRKVQS
ncbi:MAG: hypothetical protein IJ272_08680 [Clostridia bacterium]|nr:hypothetical protein [Clostridia bacterium]